MSKEWTPIDGRRVPCSDLDRDKLTNVYHFADHPGVHTWSAETKRKHYTRSPIEAGEGGLCVANVNRHGVIEAGYCISPARSDYRWYISTDQTPLE